MLNEKVPPDHVENKDRIINLLNQRREFYGPVLVKSAFKKDKEIWKNTLTRIEVLYKDQKVKPELSYDYGNFVISETSISIDDLIEFVENLVMKGRLKIKNFPEVHFEGHFEKYTYRDYLPSADDIFNLQWPADEFHLKGDGNFIGGPPGDPLVSIDKPLFPSGYEALRVFTSVDVQKYSSYVGSVIILLPNYKAKIKEIRLSSKQLTVKVVGKELNISDIVGKLYCEKLGHDVIQHDISFDGDTAEIPLRFVPDWWHVYILSKETGETLDYRRIHASWPDLPSDVIIEITPADIKEMIQRGENERVEFKQEISKKLEEFIETVVAFSNSFGGTIFIGVDDNGNIVGTYEQKIEERITNILREKCEPPIEPTIESKSIDEKQIFIVKVKEGKDKPYNVRGRGIFVRSGSTDRIASRIEVDRFYKEKQSPFVGDDNWL